MRDRTDLARALPDPLSAQERAAAARLFLADDCTLAPLSTWENLVYKATGRAATLVLRLSAATRRTRSQLEAELDWIDMLASHGVHAIAPARSRGGHRIETIALGGASYHVCAFPFIAGCRFGHAPLELDRRLADIGHCLARMHTLSEQCAAQPRNRPAWSDDYFVVHAGEMQSRVPGAVRNLYDDCLAAIAALPRSLRSYGVIHNDFHARNFFWAEGTLCAFDFDDMAHSWYMNDLGITLNWLMSLEGCDHRAARRRLLAAYGEIRPIDPAEARQADLFADFRWCLDYFHTAHAIARYPGLAPLASRMNVLMGARAQALACRASLQAVLAPGSCGSARDGTDKKN